MKLRVRHLVHVAASVGLLLGWFFLLRPVTLGGPASYVLVQGHSMDGTLAMGDLVVVTRAERYAVGDLVVFNAPAAGPRGEAVVVHRIIAESIDGRFSTQGDNNPRPDDWTIGVDDVVGKYRFHVPHVATVHKLFLALFKPYVIGALVGVFAFLMVVGDDESDDESDGGTDAGTGDGTGGGTDGGWAADAITGVGVAGVGAGVRQPEPVVAVGHRRRLVRPAIVAAVVAMALGIDTVSASAAALTLHSTKVTARIFVCPTPMTCRPR